MSGPISNEKGISRDVALSGEGKRSYTNREMLAKTLYLLQRSASNCNVLALGLVPMTEFIPSPRPGTEHCGQAPQKELKA